MRFFVRLLSFVVLLHISSAETNCLTPNGEAAKCTPIRQCGVLYEALTNTDPSVAKFITSSLCGYEDDSDERPLVCCGTRAAYMTLPDRTSCGFQVSEYRILNGEETGIAEFPWMALLQYVNRRGEKSFSCGGTLINPKYVLTAAHCADSKWITLTSVRLGEWNISSVRDCYGNGRSEYCNDPPVDVEVEEFKKHENYLRNARGVFNDIALIRLKREVTYTDFIRPICMPTKSEQAAIGQNLTVAGWGKTEKNVSSPVKLKLRLGVISPDQCLPKFRTHGVTIIDQKQICAGGEKGKDSCQGDSGGPLVNSFSNNTSQYYIEGIVSFGAICGTEGVPGIYTRVSEYLEWILENVRP